MNKNPFGLAPSGPLQLKEAPAVFEPASGFGRRVLG